MEHVFTKILVGTIVASAASAIITDSVVRNKKKIGKAFRNKESKKESK